jgi:hypothetical protein
MKSRDSSKNEHWRGKGAYFHYFFKNFCALCTVFVKIAPSKTLVLLREFLCETTPGKSQAKKKQPF